jgi:hypothetical protein
MFDYDCKPLLIAKFIKIALVFSKTTEVIFQMGSSSYCQEDWNDESQYNIFKVGADSAVLQFKPRTR